ncbi:hypothetical protein PHYSODRAFT_332991 [Phytophthora sojae]|uniref:Uncharacterized protein n=1 Tax=Phytophthora sojae (strain P6497) TaxID=1094619 RepID=G4ZMB0_PHYSP|nr:hypothetical protein PHYSODRAFT_332991 [Phytophthora sojae]EGZ14643.1 hypothetical protein PHYSODRAFT_332991 [Phytophthora sojae]|eukprot:XP_009528392.1 hypothetical protein PHYSODRAFT_332991 [Phytophthora sojae]
MEDLSRAIFLPIVLVLDAWVFQYLISVYWPRRREFRVKMLLVASFLAFITHIYSHETFETMSEFNDISETCLQLTFIIQITIIGRDVAKKVKVRSILWFTYAAETLIFVSWVDILGSIIEIAGLPTGGKLHGVENILETISLTFVLVFRFFYLSLSGGFRRVIVKRKMEFLLYMMVAMHESPFVLLEELTGLTWEFVQGIFMRLLIVSCILLNVIHKARRSGRSSFSVRSGRPSNATEEETSKAGGSTFARSPPSLRFFRSASARNVTGSARNVNKVAVGLSSSSTRQLPTGNNLDYVVDE